MSSEEDLLKPRVKIIASWPGMEFSIGTIFTLADDSNWDVRTPEGNRAWRRLNDIKFMDYPHLFQKLEWWMERSESEMPEYVTTIGMVFRVENRFPILKIKKYLTEEGDEGRVVFEDGTTGFLDYFIPATEQLYNIYKTPDNEK